MGLIRHLFSRDAGYDPERATVAGAAASTAYLAAMAVDLPLLRCPTNDLLLLGGIFSRNPRVWPTVGTALHFFNGIALAQLYGTVERRLPGPPWLRGVTFTLAENLLLWSFVPLFDRYHPAIKSGDLPQMNRPIPFVQQVIRHVAYGAVLGLIYARGGKQAAR